jgi:hypothetical protein
MISRVDDNHEINKGEGRWGEETKIGRDSVRKRRSNAGKHKRKKEHKRAIQIPTRYQNLVDWESDCFVLEEEQRQASSFTTQATESPAKRRSQLLRPKRKANSADASGSSVGRTSNSNQSVGSSFTNASTHGLANISGKRESAVGHNRTPTTMSSTERMATSTEMIVRLSESFRSALTSMFRELLSMYPLFVRKGASAHPAGAFDTISFLDAVSRYHGPDCIPFMAMFVKTRMFSKLIESRCEYCAALSAERKQSHRPVEGTYDYAFEASVRRSLNVVIAETGMVANIPKKEMLHVVIENLPEPSSSSSYDTPDKVPKLRERKRWVELEKQRLTYYQASTIRGASKKKIKGTIILDPSTTRLCVSPPIPVEAAVVDVGADDLGSKLVGSSSTSRRTSNISGTGGSGKQRKDSSSDEFTGPLDSLVEYVKQHTIKLENDSAKVILYFRCPDETTFKSWYRAITARLMPADMRGRVGMHRRGSIR